MITTQTQNDVLIMEITGAVDTSSAPRLEEEANKCMASHKKIVVNLQGTTFVSSAGLRVFLAMAKKLLAAGGKLRICNPNEVVKEILQISGFNSFIEVKNSLEEALAGL